MTMKFNYIETGEAQGRNNETEKKGKLTLQHQQNFTKLSLKFNHTEAVNGQQKENENTKGRNTIWKKGEEKDRTPAQTNKASISTSRHDIMIFLRVWSLITPKQLKGKGNKRNTRNL